MSDLNLENVQESEHSNDHSLNMEYGDHLEPPFWGTSNVLQWSNDIIFQSIKKEQLFRDEWSEVESVSNTTSFEKIDLEKMFDQIRKVATESELFQASGFYGFFPVITDDEMLVLLDPSDFHTELASLRFPRRKQSANRSIGDYFKPTGDLIALQVTTIGAKAEQYRQSRCSTDDRNPDEVYFHGLASHCSKIVAEKVSTEIRRCLGLERGVGRRFDFDDPGMPLQPEFKTQLFELLSVEERLGIELTDQFQTKPEYSLASIFVHHPAAE